MDGVKLSLGSRGMTVEVARQCAKDRKDWRAHCICRQFWFRDNLCLVPVFLRTAHPRSGGLSPGQVDPVIRCGWSNLYKDSNY